MIYQLPLTSRLLISGKILPIYRGIESLDKGANARHIQIVSFIFSRFNYRHPEIGFSERQPATVRPAVPPPTTINSNVVLHSTKAIMSPIKHGAKNKAWKRNMVMLMSYSECGRFRNTFRAARRTDGSKEDRVSDSYSRALFGTATLGHSSSRLVQRKGLLGAKHKTDTRSAWKAFSIPRTIFHRPNHLLKNGAWLKSWLGTLHALPNDFRHHCRREP